MIYDCTSLFVPDSSEANLKIYSKMAKFADEQVYVLANQLLYVIKMYTNSVPDPDSHYERPPRLYPGGK